MYAPSALTSCCTAILHALLQNPAVLVMVGLVGIGTIMTTSTSPDSVADRCLVSITAPDFAKEKDEARHLEGLTQKAVSAFESLPTGHPSEALVVEILQKLEKLSGGECMDAALVLADPELLRKIMKIHFLDIVSTARSVDEAVMKYKEDTGQ